MLLPSIRTVVKHRFLKVCTRLQQPCFSSTATATTTSSTTKNTPDTITLFNKSYPRDHQTNVTESILAKTTRALHRLPNHPLAILASRVKEHFANQNTFAWLDSLPPVVTPEQNFDNLLVPKDHVARRKQDSYYLNNQHMLRPHTSAHQVDLLSEGMDRFLIAADVYRRDEIDASHYPVFHQVEGVCVWDKSVLLEKTARESKGLREMLEQKREGKVISESTLALISQAPPVPVIENPAQPSCHTTAETDAIVQHLKASLESLVQTLFAVNATPGNGSAQDDPVITRWVDAYFPFTAPSFELEVWFQGRWLEVAGCGVIRQEIMEKAGQPNKLGWAFGIGLERLAMPLFSIPDIRLCWSTDPRFLGQFSSNGSIAKFKEFSNQPACIKDVSFWCPASVNGESEIHVEENDVFEVIRGVAGDIAEHVELIDQFQNKKTGRLSKCYRILYRSMDRAVTNEEINVIQSNVCSALEKELLVELR